MESDLELKPESEEDRFVAVLTTGRILRFNMALDTLRLAQIPFQAQAETSTGLNLAMPVMPTQGPGVFWSLLVPGEAQQVLSELPFPITTNPGPWDFVPDSETAEARADATAGKWILAIGFLAIPLFCLAAVLNYLVRGGNRDDGISLLGIGLVLGAIIVGLIWHSRRWVQRHKSSDDSNGGVRARRRPG
jgi:hypothetical protein